MAFAIRRDGREVYGGTCTRSELLADPLATSDHTASVGNAQPLANLSAATVTVNGEGSEFVALEQPHAAGQTLRVLTNWSARLGIGR